MNKIIIDNYQLYPFIFSGVFICLSILIFLYNRKILSLIFLFIGSLILGYAMANLDPFLHVWDEQYHALVSKNLIQNFLKPTLYKNPLLNYNRNNWVSNHIWLHKQPLFLWQMAISIKIFGANALAVRIPSILLHSLISIFIYRIGKITLNSNIGYYSALFFSVAYFPLELITGKYSTDHNDVAFLFYITASFWAWFEYKYSSKKYWLVIIGLFSGGAVLVKWLVGLLVFLVWGISIILTKKKEAIRLVNIYPLIFSFIISIIVFLPWQIFILINYPVEAKYEYGLNSRHFFEAIEDHGGTFWFHIESFREIYGGLLLSLFVISGVILMLKKIQNKQYRIIIISAISVVYIFYSIATTKMISFCIIVAPFFFIGLGCLVDHSINYFSQKNKVSKVLNVLIFFTLTSICFSVLKFNKIQKFHSINSSYKENSNRNIELKQFFEIQKVLKILKNDNFLVFNVNTRLNGEISMMFYTNYTAYSKIPSQKEIDELVKIKGLKIAIINKNKLPDYILVDKRLKLINQ